MDYLSSESTAIPVAAKKTPNCLRAGVSVLTMAFGSDINGRDWVVYQSTIMRASLIPPSQLKGTLHRYKYEAIVISAKEVDDIT